MSQRCLQVKYPDHHAIPCTDTRHPSLIEEQEVRQESGVNQQACQTNQNNLHTKNMASPQELSAHAVAAKQVLG